MEVNLKMLLPLLYNNWFFFNGLENDGAAPANETPPAHVIMYFLTVEIASSKN